jgi:hypothetical protein
MHCGIRDLHIMVFNICGIREDRRRKGCACRYKLNYICACIVKPYDSLKVKNAPLNFVYCVTESTILLGGSAPFHWYPALGNRILYLFNVKN